MSTNASITVKLDEGVYKSIYLHWDGYFSHAFNMLKNHYNTQAKANALIELGNLSVLAESIDCPDGHTFDTPVKGYCLAYGRDRGEESQQATMYSRELDAVSYEGQNFNYVFDGNEWKSV